MTDEEKAKEIALEIEKETSHFGVFGKEGIVIKEFKKASMEMAKWKEQQMIDKACKAYCKQCDTKECEDFGSDTCNWLQKFKRILEN